MLFTSLTFVFFFTTVFILYWSAFNNNLAFQNRFLLLCSYIFYGWWDWRFLVLLLCISVANYLIAILIQKKNNHKPRKLLFITGLVINISVLFFFKYFNFFVDGFVNLTSSLGFTVSRFTPEIILPVGISFYIFISISYLIDVYQHKLKAVSNIYEALLTFSFFPVILAGPIQRPISLLPQIQNRRSFNYKNATDGLRQALWGFFMKMVIADNCVPFVDDIFANFSHYQGSTLLVGVILFTVQIYADFAGYSNIAIGIGKLLGFQIMQNFAFPYFSRNIKEFWKKWNISLTTWFRDYVFLPIAYYVSGKIKSDRFLLIKTDYLIYIIGILITWVLTGLWHGANYTFIFWGLIHGFFLIMFHLTTKPRKRLLKRFNMSNNNLALIFLESLFTLMIIMVSWIFFRADNVNHAFQYILEICSMSLFSIPISIPNNLIILIILFFGIEWLGRKQEYAIASLVVKWPKIFRWVFYYSLILSIFYFSGTEQKFIYFQF
ncbi:MAG: MBOAT family protein [Bacteroidetes bacterium]|nr:MBOAT family protein [Bacteroidota bacterium]